MRTTYKYYNNTNSSINSGLPSAADANKYFYLPALGFYEYDKLYDLGIVGYYWSSSAKPWSSISAYNLRFYWGYVYVRYSDRSKGYRVDGFK